MVVYQSLSVQTSFGMSRGAKMNWPKIGCFSFKSQHYLQAWTTGGKQLLYSMTYQPMEKYRGPTPNEKSY